MNDSLYERKLEKNLFGTDGVSAIVKQEQIWSKMFKKTHLR